MGSIRLRWLSIFSDFFCIEYPTKIVFIFQETRDFRVPAHRCHPIPNEKPYFFLAHTLLPLRASFSCKYVDVYILQTYAFYGVATISRLLKITGLFRRI